MICTDLLLSKLQQHFQLSPERARVLVVGMGSTGFSAAQFLHTTPIPFAVIDSRPQPPLIDRFRNELPEVAVFTGGFDQSAFEVATHLVVSPGVSLNEAAIARALQAGVTVLSDIDLFACATDKPVVAITGSNGKSTVTTLLGDMGKAAGINTAIGGNLGTPALELLQQNADLYVLELSSFQLEKTSALNASAAVVLNISPDHLDHHADMADYATEKQRIFRGNGVMVLNADDPVVMTMTDAARQCLNFSVEHTADFYLDSASQTLMHGTTPLLKTADLTLEGRHNSANVLAALALGHAVGLSNASMCQAIRQFVGLPHRMQKVAERNGIRWINDSKATNIGACIAALQGYSTPVVLIAGGDGKGADMRELQATVASKTKAVVVMGKDANAIEEALADLVPVVHAEDMKSAVAQAAQLASTGDTVLLSPACASLDQYQSYADRGNQFAKAVQALDLC